MSAQSYWQQLDAMVEAAKPKRAAVQRGLKLSPLSPVRMPLTLTEMTLIDNLQRNVVFVPGSSHKRFVRSLTMNSELSERGRAYLAFIAHRYRRQWKPTDEEFEWMVRWRNY